MLRPHFVTEEELRRQTELVDHVISAVRRVRAALSEDERLAQAHLGKLHDWIGDLLELETQPAGEGALMRLDASLARTQRSSLCSPILGRTSASAPPSARR